MVLSHCSWVVLSILTIKGIAGQFYSQINPNSHYYSGSYNNRNYNGNYNGNFNPNLLRYADAAIRPGELVAEINENSVQTPCRNKEANKEHKDTLWWTLPIPPMELEGPPEKPPQIKQPEPVQQAETKPQASASVETGAIQQKHGPIAPTSTAKAQVAPAAAPTPQAVAQVVTTAKHEAASTAAPSKQDKSKIAQLQKQQQQQAQAAAPAQAQPQNTAPVPSQLVVSNKENANQQQLITNKSVATMRAPGRGAMAPIIQHGSNKQKVMLNMNVMDPAGYQYGQESMPMPPAYMNNPYFNSPYLREPQLEANRGYRSDMIDSISALADNMYKDFDSNDAELGGGSVVGDNAPYGAHPIPVPMVGYENNYAPVQQHSSIDQWASLSEDERNKRNPQNNFIYKPKVAIS